MRNNRMDEYEREISVTVVVGRFGIDREDQGAAALRGRFGGGHVVKHEKTSTKGEGQSRFRPAKRGVIAGSSLSDEAISIQQAQSRSRLLRPARNDGLTVAIQSDREPETGRAFADRPLDWCANALLLHCILHWTRRRANATDRSPNSDTAGRDRPFRVASLALRQSNVGARRCIGRTSPSDPPGSAAALLPC